MPCDIKRDDDGLKENELYVGELEKIVTIAAYCASHKLTPEETALAVRDWVGDDPQRVYLLNTITYDLLDLGIIEEIDRSWPVNE